jgi:hypothetical protein
MKKTFLILCACIATGCLPKLPDFLEIQGDKLRVIGIVFSPRPDAAPGDTITARAYFAGKAAQRIDGYKISYSIVKPDTFVDQREPAIVGKKMWLPDSMEVSFVIAESLFTKDATCPALAPDLVDKINTLSKDTAGCAALTADSGPDIQNALRLLSRESGLLFDLHSDDGATLKVQSRFLVRYNSRFRKCMDVNNNPDISAVRLYSVEGKNIKSFDPDQPDFHGRFTSQPIYDASSPESIAETLRIRDNTSYFLGPDSLHTDFYTNNLGIREAETIQYAYFYEMDKSIGSDYDSVVTQINPLSRLAKLKLPEYRSPYSVKIRLVIHDESSDAVWPKGFAVKTMVLTVIGQ